MLKNQKHNRSLPQLALFSSRENTAQTEEVENDDSKLFKRFLKQLHTPPKGYLLPQNRESNIKPLVQQDFLTYNKMRQTNVSEIDKGAKFIQQKPIKSKKISAAKQLAQLFDSTPRLRTSNLTNSTKRGSWMNVLNDDDDYYYDNHHENYKREDSRSQFKLPKFYLQANGKNQDQQSQAPYSSKKIANTQQYSTNQDSKDMSFLTFHDLIVTQNDHEDEQHGHITIENSFAGIHKNNQGSSRVRGQLAKNKSLMQNIVKSLARNERQVYKSLKFAAEYEKERVSSIKNIKQIQKIDEQESLSVLRSPSNLVATAQSDSYTAAADPSLLRGGSDKSEKKRVQKLLAKSVLVRSDQQKNEQKSAGSSEDEQQIASAPKDMELYWYDIDQGDQWKPGIREGGCLVASAESGVGTSCYLYGGAGQTLYEEVNQLFPENQYQWTKVQSQVAMQGSQSQRLQQTPAAPGRHGHSVVHYTSGTRQSLVVFGGEGAFNEKMKRREFLNDVYIFGVNSQSSNYAQWRKLSCSNNMIMQRKGHATALVGRNMLIMGGLSEAEKIFGDCWALDLHTLVWSECWLEQELQLVYHKAKAVFHESRGTNIQLGKPYDLKVTKVQYRHPLKVEGVYIFGGMRSSGIHQQQQQQLNSPLRVLKIDCSPFVCITPEVLGQSPCDRFAHSFEMCSRLNIIVLFGGVLDKAKSQQYLNDLHILDLATLTWVQVTQYGALPSARAYHCAAVCDSKFIIFGGLNSHGFVSNTVCALELDGNVVKKLAAVKQTEKSIQIIQESQNSVTKQHTPLKIQKSQPILVPQKGRESKILTFMPVPRIRSSQLQLQRFEDASNQMRLILQSLTKKTDP